MLHVALPGSPTNAVSRVTGGYESNAKFDESDDDDLDDDSDDEDEDDEVAAKLKVVEATDKELEARSTMSSSSDRRPSNSSSLSDSTYSTSTSKKFSFSRMKAGLATRSVEAEEQSEKRGPQFTLKVQVSQPKNLKEDYLNRQQEPKEVEMHLFEVTGRHIQPCCFQDVEYGENNLTGEGDKTFYTFPANNRIKMREEKTPEKFRKKHHITIKPGHYIVVVYQQSYKDDLSYCIRFDCFDDPLFPTNYKMQVEEIGTCVNPKLPPPPSLRTKGPEVGALADEAPEVQAAVPESAASPPPEEEAEAPEQL
eukprot:TRINITY_DN60947_c0_g1_i2.p1 TRINITY_DN60947_c0_g1~~TRINITY_DN60947_c0_g1_i2.p1  ORF type:complete len:309 (+),score=53.44 TRINITY_DN60947_c0_g1_i2:204-1130(+)